MWVILINTLLVPIVSWQFSKADNISHSANDDTMFFKNFIIRIGLFNFDTALPKSDMKSLRE